MFELEFKLNKDILLKASKIVYEYEYKNSFKRYLGWFFIALLQFGVVALIKKGNAALFLISSILVIYWYFLRWPIRKYLYLKVIKSSKLDKYPIKVIFSDNGIVINNSTISWEKITKILNSDIGLLIFIGKEFILVPKEAIKDKKELIEFLKNKTKLIEV